MNSPEDQKLIDEVQREIDTDGQREPDKVLTAEKQDWINTARLLVQALRAGHATDERAAARVALEHTPPPRL